MQSYKQLNSIFEEEIKKLNDRNKFVEGFLLQKRLQKIKKIGNNNQNNGIREYIIDDEDDYPEVNCEVKKIEEEGMDSNSKNSA